jgi:hypothetical protein
MPQPKVGASIRFVERRNHPQVLDGLIDIPIGPVERDVRKTIVFLLSLSPASLFKTAQLTDYIQ